MMELTKCIFYHNNKTGGDWVKDALRNACKVVKEEAIHCNRGYYSSDTKKSFAFVRYPVGAYESIYNHYNRKDIRFFHNYSQWLFPLYCTLPFDQFVESMVTKHPGWLSGYCDKFVHGIDFVGRQEYLKDNLFDILDAIGEPYDRGLIESTPKSNVGHYKILMTPKLRLLIEKSEKSMIDRFYG